MKRVITILIFVLPLAIFAQENPIDLAGYFSGKYRADRMRQFAWESAPDQYSYFDAKDSTKVSVNAKTGKEVSRVPYTKPQKYLNIKALQKDGRRIKDFNEKLYIYNKERDNGWYVGSFEDKSAEVMLCTDTGKNIVFGEPVHRSEWNINEGWYFSPNDRYIAFYRMNESMVEDYPLLQTGGDGATVDWIKYPMAGRTSHQVKVGIFDAERSFKSKKPVYQYINTAVSDGEFLTNVTFSPDEKYLYITHLNREQNHSKLIRYDLLTGEKNAVLIEEHDDRYVEPQTRMIFMKNGNFVWQSDRDGWNHFYLYSFDGQLIRQITSGQWEVIEALGFDEKEENLYFMTNKDNPVDNYLYSVNLKNGQLTNHTPESGTHSVRLSDDKKYFLDEFTNLHTPLNTYIRSTDGKIKRLLLSSSNKYANHNLGVDTIFSIKNKNGNDLYCRMLLPPDFNPKEKYPCLVYVYGGPHSQLVTNEFMSGGIFMHYMAQKGYVVFTLDNRGTNNRGSDFEKCIHRQLGVLESEDQMAGIDYLQSLQFIDNERIGLDGWSFGGFMTLTLVTEHPEVFRAASCGGPVVNWAWYEVMYGERYMDTPAENPQGYEHANIIPKIKNLRCPLLVMHGMQDHTVIQKNSLELMHQAVKDDVQIQYYPYTTHDHNVLGPDRVQMWHKIEQFHDEYLKK